MADEIKPTEEPTEVKAHSVLDMQESSDADDVEAHGGGNACISVLSVNQQN